MTQGCWMTRTKKLKASERQAIARKVMTVLKKKYGGGLPRDSRPVLETLLFAACLENANYESAERVYAHMLESFHDLNEIRVTSITEIERVLAELPDPDWKALRVRETLQHTFEKHYSFDIDALKRKTMDVAEKRISEIRYLTPFMRLYALQHCLGSHVVPVDDRTLAVLVWLGLVADDATPESAAEEMKSGLKKQDTPLFVHLLRAVATDPKYAGTFTLTKPGKSAKDEGFDPTTAPERLKQHLARPPRKAARRKVTTARKKKPTTKPKTAKKASSGRTRAKSVTKKVSRPKSRTTKRRVKHK
jgi:endonuclease III